MVDVWVESPRADNLICSQAVIYLSCKNLWANVASQKGLSRHLRSGLITLDYYTKLDIVWGLCAINREFALISQRQSGNMGFQTFHAEQ